MIIEHHEQVERHEALRCDVEGAMVGSEDGWRGEGGGENSKVTE